MQKPFLVGPFRELFTTYHKNPACGLPLSSLLLKRPLKPTLDRGITNLWRIDSLGVQDSPEGSQDNNFALELFESHVSKKGECYEVSLFLREPGLDTSQGNYTLAKQRLSFAASKSKQIVFPIMTPSKHILINPMQSEFPTVIWCPRPTSTTR